MIPLKRLKNRLNKTKKNYTGTDFFDLHRYVEAYIKRVFLISLRLQSVRYDHSKSIVEHWYLPTEQLMHKAVKFLRPDGESLNHYKERLRAHYPDYNVLKTLFIDYTSPFRNRFAHGAVGEFKNPDLVCCLYHIDQSFYKELELMLNTEYGKSAFDLPGDWGAPRGKDESIDEVFTRLCLGGRENVRTIKLNDALLQVGQTKYGLP